MKVRKLKVKKNDDGLRRGYIEFKGDKIPIRSLSYKEDKRIIELFEIEKLSAEMNFYEGRIDDPKLSKDAKLEIEGKIKDLRWKLNEAANGAAFYKTMQAIERPDKDKWFDSLSLAELQALTTTVSAWLMHVDIDELYMEIFKEAMFTFEMSKKDSNMTGQEVADILRKMEDEYLSLKKKPKCLDTALRCAKARIVQDVYKESINTG